MRPIHIIGQRYGILTVIRRIAGSPKTLCECRCDCGVVVIIQQCNLRSGATKSCGCSKSRFVSEAKLVHGHKRRGKVTKAYRVWLNMIQRCTNPNNKSYSYYGGNGVTVDERWLVFEKFLEDMGEPPTNRHEIDRKDRTGNYSPSNCHWVTRKENARNRRNNRVLHLNGERLCVSEWAEKYGIRSQTIIARLSRGWSAQRAIQEPINGKRNRTNL